MTPYEIITDQRGMGRLSAALSRERSVAVDLECASGLHHYAKRVCLIQMASRDRAFVVDPLAGLDLAPLKAILEDPAVEIVMHDADFDMRSLDRDFGVRPRNIFDTLIAARLCGHRQFGLSSMLEHYFGVMGSKRFQRADWTIRPLPADMLDYAAGDVAHLVELRDLLEAELVRLGRIDWALAKFAERELIRHEPDERPAFARIKRAKERCDGRALAVLDELARARDEIARRLDLSLFRVISDDNLVELANRPPSDASDLARRRGMHPYLRGRGAAEIMAAVKRGLARPRLSWPRAPRHGRRALHSADLMDAIKSWRAKVAAEHGVEPDLILSMRSVKDLAHGTHLDEVLASEASNRWHIGTIRESLARLLSDCRRAV
ncbi:MAG: ribonuclease D [Proteobacteria bacterium]|nr:ribonuclease D [Pseudomonadota bacterium]